MAVRCRLAELCRPHLMLSDVGRDDGVTCRDFIETVEHMLRAKPALLRVFQRITLPPSFTLTQPLVGIRGADLWDQLL